MFDRECGTMSWDVPDDVDVVTDVKVAIEKINEERIRWKPCQEEKDCPIFHLMDAEAGRVVCPYDEGLCLPALEEYNGKIHNNSIMHRVLETLYRLFHVKKQGSL